MVLYGLLWYGAVRLGCCVVGVWCGAGVVLCSVVFVCLCVCVALSPLWM